MCLYHEFDRICNIFPRWKRVSHPFMAHGDTVTDTDGIKLKRSPAPGSNPFPDPFTKKAEMGMAWNDGVPGVCDTDKGLVHLALIYPKGTDERAIRSPGISALDIITPHNTHEQIGDGTK
jgi:hypothetical protein